MTVYGEWEQRAELDEIRQDEQQEKEREMAEHLATLAEIDPWCPNCRRDHDE